MPERELEETINLAKKAGKEILKIYQKKSKSKQKKDGSPVTEADLISQKIILSGLKKFGYGILSEERKDDPSRFKKEKVWIVDPLDGTQDFLKKTGDFSIMIGLAYNQKPILGVIYKPIGDKLYFAEKEKGTYLKQGKKSLKKLKVSNISNLGDARFVMSRFHLDNSTKEFLKNNKIKKALYCGSIGIKMSLIAEGKADGYITFTDKTCQWDICAPEIILQEAGGKVSNLNGENFIYNRQELKNLNGIVGSNKNIYNQIINYLKTDQLI